MFKQFMKLFRGNENPADAVDHPHVEALQGDPEKSYLGFLLDAVQPRVEKRLKKHPDSDPVLEVASSLLLEIFPEHWKVGKGPLVDKWTPKPKPPPPPVAPPPPAPAVTDEADEEEVEEVEVDEGLADESDEFEVVVVEEADEDEEETDEEEADEDEEEADEEAEEEFEIVVEEDDVVVEAEEEEDPPAGFSSALDDTAEFEPPPVTRHPESEEDPWPITLAGDSLLHGSRVLLAVLLDNDRLPREEQLDVAEVLMAADLWGHLLAQQTNVGDRVQRLAKLVERKFGEGHFSQARLLLQVFPANAETRINNDRQLFYEEMILRMGIRRRAHLLEEVTEDIREALSEISLDDEEEVRDGFRCLAEGAQAQMCVYTRDQSEVERWKTVVSDSKVPGAEAYLLKLVPPRRWQGVWKEDRSLRQVLREQLVRPMARDHVVGHLKTAYFILRAVGDTGLEGYLDCFFEWSERVCGVNAVKHLPEIYNRTLSPREMIDPVFNDVYDRVYREPVGDVLKTLDTARVDEAFEEAIRRIVGADLSGLAPGNFNLGGFVFDSLLEMEYPTPEFGFRLHRLT